VDKKGGKIYKSIGGCIRLFIPIICKKRWINCLLIWLKNTGVNFIGFGADFRFL
jgi:hypothetical protein